MTDHNDRCCSPEQFAGQAHPDCSGLRPPVPFAAPDGLHWEAAPRDDWRFVSGKRCRRQGKGHKTCTNEAVAELNRGRIASYVRSDLRTVDSWWAYCADHMYGNWIEDGQVWRWKLVKNDD